MDPDWGGFLRRRLPWAAPALVEQWVCLAVELVAEVPVGRADGATASGAWDWPVEGIREYAARFGDVCPGPGFQAAWWWEGHLCPLMRKPPAGLGAWGAGHCSSAVSERDIRVTVSQVPGWVPGVVAESAVTCVHPH